MSISLSSTLRNCKVSDEDASRAQSDRYLNMNSMSCIPPASVNERGQEVCSYSMNRETAGCHNPVNRVDIEGRHRQVLENAINNTSNHYFNNLPCPRTGALEYSNSNAYSGFNNDFTSNIRNKSCN